MAVSKEKKDVLWRTFIDGKLNCEVTKKQMVYTREDGSQYVSHMGSQKTIKNDTVEIHIRNLNFTPNYVPGIKDSI